MDEIFFEKDDGCSYIESLIRSRIGLSKITEELEIIEKLNSLISLELDISILGAKKALNEAIKESTKDNVRPIK